MTVAITAVLLAASIEQLAGQDTGQSQPANWTGQQMVQRAATELANWPAVEIRVRQRAAVFDQEVIGSGIYLHQRTERGLRVRLELKLQVADRLTTVLQVSDGQFLWLRREGQGGASLGQVDLEELNAACAAADSSKFSAMPASLLANGGLPRVLAGLGESFSFGAPVAAQLESTPVWVVQGQWAPKMLARLFPSDQEEILAGNLPDMRRLPRQMPTSVRVVLRQPDLVPLRIDYRRLSSDDATKADDGDRSLLLMEFYEVRRHESLDDGLFQYEPGDQPVEDRTYLYLQKLLPEEPEEE